jgi:hypothetical protein
VEIRPDLIGRRGARWHWDRDRCAYYPADTPGTMGWSRQALDVLHGPLQEVADPAMALAADFISAARQLRDNTPEAALNILMPRTLGPDKAHERVHLLALCGAVVTGAAVRSWDHSVPLPGQFYGFDITDESPEPAEVEPAKVLAARLMTGGANIDHDVIRDLIIAACSVSARCRLLSQTVVELARIFAALDTATAVPG